MIRVLPRCFPNYPSVRIFSSETFMVIFNFCILRSYFEYDTDLHLDGPFVLYRKDGVWYFRVSLIL